MFWAALAVVFCCLWIGTLGIAGIVVWELGQSNREVASLSAELERVVAERDQDLLQKLNSTLDETEGALRYSEWLRRLERREYITTIREARWMQRQFARMAGR